MLKFYHCLFFKIFPCYKNYQTSFFKQKRIAHTVALEKDLEKDPIN